MSRVHIEVNGQLMTTSSGTSVAAALLNADIAAFRHSVGGEPRMPLCGMGSCQECRVTIDGVPHQRACLRTVSEGMRVMTDG